MPRPTVPLLVSEDQSKQIEQWLAALRNTAASGAAVPHCGCGGRRGIGGCHRCGAAGEPQDSSALAGSFCRPWVTGPVGYRAGPRTQGYLRSGSCPSCNGRHLQSKPKGITPWSCRLLAENQGLSKATVSRFWRSHNLKPHRINKFKLSRDPGFLEKLTDVVGLYLKPPDQAIVLCGDEKSQIQA